MLNYFLNILVFLYVLFAFVLTPVPGLSTITNIILILLLVNLALRSFKLGLYGLNEIWFFFPIFCYMFATILWSTHQHSALISFISFSTAYLGGIAVYISLRNGGNIKSIYYGSLLASFILVYSAITTDIIITNTATNFRAAGISGNPNLMGLCLITCAFFIYSLGKKHIFNNIYPITIILFAIYTTGSRKIIIVIPFIIIYIILSKYKNIQYTKSMFLKLRKYTALLIIIPLISYIAISVTESSFAWERMLKFIEGNDSSSSVRIAMIEEGISLWKEAPIFGHGINQYRYFSFWDTYSHNNYIEIMVSSGIIGFILYYLVYFKILKYLLKSKNNEHMLLYVLMFVLLLVWEFALVSYQEKYVWIFLGISFWIAHYSKSSLILSK